MWPRRFGVAPIARGEFPRRGDLPALPQRSEGGLICRQEWYIREGGLICLPGFPPWWAAGGLICVPTGGLMDRMVLWSNPPFTFNS